jgi:hypothetical protein
VNDFSMRGHPVLWRLSSLDWPGTGMIGGEES